MLPVSVTPHTQQSGQSLKEEALYPGSHGVVGGRGTVVDINDEDGNDDGEGDKYHDKEQIFSNQGNHLRRQKFIFHFMRTAMLPINTTPGCFLPCHSTSTALTLTHVLCYRWLFTSCLLFEWCSDASSD